MSTGPRTGYAFTELLYAAADAAPARMPSAAPVIVGAVVELLVRVADEFDVDTCERWFLAKNGWHLWMYESIGATSPRSDWTAAVALARILTGEAVPCR